MKKDNESTGGLQKEVAQEVLVTLNKERERDGEETGGRAGTGKEDRRRWNESLAGTFVKD